MAVIKVGYSQARAKNTEFLKLCRLGRCASCLSNLQTSSYCKKSTKKMASLNKKLSILFFANLCLLNVVFGQINFEAVDEQIRAARTDEEKGKVFQGLVGDLILSNPDSAVIYLFNTKGILNN